MKTICLDISLLSEKNKTGIGVYTYELIKALLKINKQDKFILFGIATLETYDYLNNIEFKKNKNVTLKIYKMPAKFFRTSFLLWQKINFPKIEKLVGKVDIFHSFNWNLLPQGHGKSVATVFDMTPVLFPSLHLEKTIQLDRVRLQRIKKYTDLVVTISQNSKKDFLEFAPNKKVEVIYPATSESFSKKVNLKQSEKVLKKYDISPGYILSVGTLEPRKNIESLIKAYLKTNLDRVLVLVGGGGWKNSQIKELIDVNQDKIKVLGFVNESDLLVLYQNAVCFVYPSIYEGFGIPILEAMASKVPVISSNTSSLPEVGGQAPLYIDPKKIEELQRALKSIVSDNSLRQKMVSKAVKQVKKFSWKKSAIKLNALYQQLAEESK